jgi:hypothetical protein
VDVVQEGPGGVRVVGGVHRAAREARQDVRVRGPERKLAALGALARPEYGRAAT